MQWDARTLQKKYGDSKGLFWEVKKGKATVYMLGSIHLGDKNLFPMQQAIEDAFESSKIVVGEFDLTNTAKLSEVRKSTGFYQNGETTFDHL